MQSLCSWTISIGINFHRSPMTLRFFIIRKSAIQLLDDSVCVFVCLGVLHKIENCNNKKPLAISYSEKSVGVYCWLWKSELTNFKWIVDVVVVADMNSEPTTQKSQAHTLKFYYVNKERHLILRYNCSQSVWMALRLVGGLLFQTVAVITLSS